MRQTCLSGASASRPMKDEGAASVTVVDDVVDVTTVVELEAVGLAALPVTEVEAVAVVAFPAALVVEDALVAFPTTSSLKSPSFASLDVGANVEVEVVSGTLAAP